MATRKIEVNEDDLKKVILMLKLSKQYLQIPSDDLTLVNLWRVSGKLADKLMRKAELTITTNKGRTTLKPLVPSDAVLVDIPTRTPRCRKRKK